MAAIAVGGTAWIGTVSNFTTKNTIPEFAVGDSVMLTNGKIVQVMTLYTTYPIYRYYLESDGIPDDAKELSQIGYNDADGIQNCAINKITAVVQKQSSWSIPIEKECTCDIIHLTARGCKCGAITPYDSNAVGLIQ